MQFGCADDRSERAVYEHDSSCGNRVIKLWKSSGRCPRCTLVHLQKLVILPAVTLAEACSPAPRDSGRSTGFRVRLLSYHAGFRVRPHGV